MDSALVVHRLHFAFTATFHYLFPQLTMGLAPLIVLFKLMEARAPGRGYGESARLLARLFAVNFVFGVVTGVPMEFQFGTNWARFSRFAGGVIGQTLAMEGMFAFFLESSFLGLFLFGEKRLSPRAHLASAVAVFLGSWLSGYFIVATDAWMQHPVGYAMGDDGSVRLESLSALLFNRWAFWQYLHTMGGALVTGAFATAGLGAYYVLRRRPTDDARVSAALLKTGVVVAALASVWQTFPSGDQQGSLVAHNQPATLAAMEGLFHTTAAAPIVLMGQPNTDEKRIDNTLEVPGVLSVLTYRRWSASVHGLDEFAPEARPDNVALLYYSYHLMVGLGTMFAGLMALALLALWRGRLLGARPLLWALVLAVPLPYVANTAGWITAEIGRQPWLVYGLLRTEAGTSHHVSAGNGLFSLLGFMGLYSVLSIAFVLVVARIVARGSAAAPVEGAH
ncbi:MAG TPA: cytochrome ubiquinol oxidase subunit I [Polyangia bacterium]|nr:cytochrome ubiquinol oxidase subunit I [Polyangia bacterium]HVZ73862.1 cytochrome ubiquinol oxidase subunit I [Polyangia bacterium]